jgi:hypothetical protein
MHYNYATLCQVWTAQILTSKVLVRIDGFCDHMMMVNNFVIYDGSYVKQNQIAQVTTKEIQVRKMLDKK